MIEKIKKFIRIITILLMTALVIFLIYTVFKYEWKNILCFVSVITVFLIICWAFDWWKEGVQNDRKCMCYLSVLWKLQPPWTLYEVYGVQRKTGKGWRKCTANWKMMHSMNGADNGKKNTDGRSPGRNRRKSDGCSTGVTANYISSMLGMSSGQWWKVKGEQNGK